MTRPPRDPEAPRAPLLPSGADGLPADDGSLLRRYLRDVRGIPPLSADEESRLGLELLERRQLVAERVARIPDLRARVAALEAADYPGSALRELSRELATTEAHRDARARTRARRALEAIASLEELRARFVQANLRLVIFLSRPYRQDRVVGWLDLIQEGNLGLVRAVEKFDARRGFKFSSYAVWWIEQAFVRGRQRQAYAIRLPSQVHGQIAARRRSEAQLTGRLGREPRPDELARELGVERGRVEGLLALDQDLLSLQAPLRTSAQELGDTLPAPPRDVEGELDGKRGCRRVGALLERLEPRERSILRHRFGLGGDDAESLAEVGTRLGISRERVRQIERGALAKLRAELETGAALGSPAS